MDAVTKAIIEAIGAAGFTVQLYGQDGQNVVEAVDEETQATFVVMIFTRWAWNWRNRSGSSWRMGRHWRTNGVQTPGSLQPERP